MQSKPMQSKPMQLTRLHVTAIASRLGDERFPDPGRCIHVPMRPHGHGVPRLAVHFDGLNEPIENLPVGRTYDGRSA
jgi:hypothetical protein